MRQLVAVLGRGVVPASEAVATADDAGLVRGDGCFDAMRVLGGGLSAVVENLDVHLARFASSAAILELPFDEPAWRELIATAVAAWPPSTAEPVGPAPDTPPAEAVLKLVLTRGPESARGAPTAFLTITELDLQVMRRARAGITVRTLDRGYSGNAFADAPWLLGGAKLLSYAVNAAAKRVANTYGDDDALFVSTDGFVLEAPTAAVVLLRGDQLVTPAPGASGILDSITVRQMFAAAAAAGVRGSYEQVRADELCSADGVWLASSIRGVCPVLRLDGQQLAVDAEWNARVTAWGGF